MLNAHLSPGPLPSRMQLTADGQLKHFLTVEGLPPLLLEDILKRAEQFVTVPNKQQKKAPLLRGKTVMNLFFENSTRTRVTFEIAAQRLGADVINLDIRTSSASKGETLLDTIRNLEAMNADMFVVRHEHAGAAHFIARYCAPHVSVLNAGDGRHSHPTQAMLDMFTIRQKKGSFQPLKVAHQIYFKFRADPHSKLKSDVFVSVGSAIAPGSGFEADSIGFLYIFLNANPESVQPGLVSN